MSWHNDYKNKCVKAEEAVQCIKSNQRVVIGHACGEPQDIVEAMVNRAAELSNVEIVHMVAMGPGKYTKPEMEGHFRHNALFVGGCTRRAIAEGRADYTPRFFYEIPALFKSKSLAVDIAMIQVSSPDKHGYCSYGVSVDYTKAAAENAEIVIAEINSKMPRTYGSYIHVSDIDYIVETSNNIIELPRPEISHVEKKIGENVAKLIEDGSTLQLGIGAIPDAVLKFLTNKKDLGIHSEMISDGVVELVNRGVINNSRKTVHAGEMVVTFLMGTRELYGFVDNNPMLKMLPVDYVNNPTIIGQNDKMISINSAVEVDLMGQVAAESINGNQISGVGGQVDFVRGAAFSNGGKSVIALPSTAADGKISRIVSKLKAGTPVTTSRNDIDYVITEYGIAKLKGKTLSQRAKLLTSISHPKFREKLSKEFLS
ncbi:MAG: acetyl-CoA hydrolase/transferase family protein [Firmicutes bacterium]|nr:acetyl-CoA hydrolase/transferase family protein [Bacillota bacterium]